MPLILVSFFAGILTIAAPCILPLLPIIIGGSLVDEDQDNIKLNKYRPLIIAVSLAASVITFTLLIKATSALLGVPTNVWQTISAVILVFLGLNYIFPKLWGSLSLKFNFFGRTNSRLTKAVNKKGLTGAILTGAALGPVFNSCSPTYALIIATVISTSFFTGLVYLISYATGMSLALLFISHLGRVATSRLRFLANPKSPFKKVIGILFILVGVSIAFGVDKNIQSYILEKGWYSPISNLEQKLKK